MVRGTQKDYFCTIKLEKVIQTMKKVVPKDYLYQSTLQEKRYNDVSVKSAFATH